MTELSGVVVRGQGLGAKIGYPTANIRFEGHAPARGVWAVVVSGEDLKAHKAVCNVGVRPTVSGDGALAVEVHIPDFSADLYGKRLTIAFMWRIRDEKKFPSIEELKAQITRDVADLLR